MNSKWDREKTLTLIRYLESFPELWNCSVKEYRDRQLKTRAIETIAKCMKESVAEIKRKLHNLRCQLNSQLRKLTKAVMSGEGHDDVWSSRWEFFEALKFMTAYCNVGKLPYVGHGFKVKDEKLSEDEFVMPSHYIKRGKRKFTPDADEYESLQALRPGDDIIVDEEQLMLEPACILKGTTDDYTVFGDYVASELRQIRSEERRKRLKLIIQKAIVTIGEEEEMETSYSTAYAPYEHSRSSYFSGETSTSESN